MTVLGIMTHAAGTPARYDMYAQEALRLGFDGVLLFAPKDVDLRRRRVDAWAYERGGWRRRVRPLPDLAHDMGFYAGAATIRAARRVKAPEAAGGIPFVGYALGHKWTIHQRLLRTPYAAYLPETASMRSGEAAVRMADRYGAAMVKPRDGKQGKGIVKISREGPGKYRWQEQGGASSRLTRKEAAARLDRRFRPDAAIVQRWMDIRCPKGGVFDIRALAQKAEGDAWRTTAAAVRQSGIGRIASNVTAGGAVWAVDAFLADMYGEAEAARIAGEAGRIAAELPGELERAYGKRFVELGIDLAVERGGAVRIIEVNIKPGKKIVRALSGERAYADALLQPIRYAKWLSDRRDSLWTDS